MKNTDGVRTVGPRDMLDKMIPLLVAKDLSSFADLFAEDGVQESGRTHMGYLR